MRLWDKGQSFDSLIEQFTVGEDYILDRRLVIFDCIASFAHATMLLSIGILSEKEFEMLKEGLREIGRRHRDGRFVIERQQEDCHTSIENFLCEYCGDAGKKIHTARSRNDQVLTALRLYMKAEILVTLQRTVALSMQFVDFARAHANVAIPGRTHMQLAMPSSFGLWAGAMAESLLDDAFMLRDVHVLIDQCTLGSASSYGTAVPIDRALVADILLFRKVQNNVLYANNSRGKFEAAVIHALNQLCLSLTKSASDLMFFALPEIGYVSLPLELCSGSSLMPQKKNPCALELLRAKSATMASLLSQVMGTVRALPSGYHRDFQETKAPLMTSFDIAQTSCLVIEKHIAGLKVNHAKCESAFQPELFATDEALALAQKGVPFREAYQRIADHLDRVSSYDAVENVLAKKHIGAPGNLGLELLCHEMDKLKPFVDEQTRNQIALFQLLGIDD